MIRILLTLLFISSGVFAAASSDDSSSSMSADEQVIKLYDKAYELVLSLIHISEPTRR